MMPPVLSALQAFVVSLFRSRASLRLENLALRPQVAVYQQTVHRPRLRPTDRVFWPWLSRLWPGWQGVLAFVQPRSRGNADVWALRVFGNNKDWHQPCCTIFKDNSHGCNGFHSASWDRRCANCDGKQTSPHTDMSKVDSSANNATL
jgi:hypothetical protein